MFSNIDISFKNYSNKNDIHGTILYPAPMIAPIQNVILNELLPTDKNKTLLDPFHGSGISLYEAKSLSSKFNIIGIDINPYATFITKCKLDGIDTKTIETDLASVIESYHKSPFYCIVHFHKINKWFREDIICKLSLLKKCIMDTTNPRNRNFMLLIFANLVRKFSNTRTSTYKLHQKRDNEISNLSSNILDTFIKQARKATEHFTFSTSDYQLYKANTLDVMPVLDDESVDIILTSPPYGDNQTTVPYGQFSSLALYWLQGTGAEFEGWELESYNVIDSSSMGGRKKHYNFNELQNEIIDIRTRGVSNNKINKVLNFLHDYFKFLDEATRISKEYIILTLGNRTVDGIRISLTEITKDYLSCKPFNLVKQFERELQNKRIPDYVSNVDNRPVQSMKKEYVLVFKK